MQTVTSADGTRIAFEVHGDGSPLILIHGGSAPQYWQPVVSQFTDNHKVIIPHRRGTGASGDTDNYYLNRGVEDMRSVIEACNEPPAVFGHSFGGLLAIEVSRTTPIEKLIAYEPAVLVDEYRRQASLASKMEGKLSDGDRHNAMKFYIDEVMHGGESEDLDAWLAEWPPWPNIVELTENIVRINQAIEQYRLPDTLEINAPTLLLAGSEGPSHLHEGIIAVNQAIPDAQLIELNQVGHGGPAEAPELVIPEVKRFLTESTVPPSDLA